MNRSTVAIFEILEKAWATQNCTLVDMKVSAEQCCPLLVNMVSFRVERFPAEPQLMNVILLASRLSLA